MAEATHRVHTKPIRMRDDDGNFQKLEPGTKVDGAQIPDSFHDFLEPLEDDSGDDSAAAAETEELSDELEAAQERVAELEANLEEVAAHRDTLQERVAELEAAQDADQEQDDAQEDADTSAEGIDFASPRAKEVADELGVGADDLEGVEPEGETGYTTAQVRAAADQEG